MRNFKSNALTPEGDFQFRRLSTYWYTLDLDLIVRFNFNLLPIFNYWSLY